MALLIVLILIVTALTTGIWTAVGLGILGFIILAVLGMIN